MLFWSTSPLIYRFSTLQKEGSMNLVSFHSQEIRQVSYSKHLEKVISVDESFKAVVWDINSLQRCQVIVFDHTVEKLFSFKSSPQVISLGSESFLLEKVRLADFLGEFYLWEAHYDSTLKKFVVITNHDVRYLDFIDGEIGRVLVHCNKEIIADTKFFHATKERKKNNCFVAMGRGRQFCLYNSKTMEYFKAVHAVDENSQDVASCMHFISGLDLLAVGYYNSKIKGKKIIYIFLIITSQRIFDLEFGLKM